MKNFTLAICVILFAGFVSGCQGMKKRDIGTIAGAGTGALVGSAIGGGAVIVGGAVVGGIAGHQIGKSMEHN